MWLYRWYAKIFPATDDAAALANYGRAINVALLSGALLIVAAFVGSQAFCASIGSLVFAGFAWAQLASVTNDFPQTLFGLLLGALLGSMMLQTSRRARWLLAASVLLILPATLQIDRSWISTFLLAPAFACVWLGPRLPSTALAIALPWLGVAAAVAIGPLLPSFFVDLLPKEVAPHVSSWPTLLELQTTWQAMRVALKSLFGSFLWGHAYYPKWLNALMAIAVIAATGLLAGGRLALDGARRRIFFMAYSSVFAATTAAWLLVARFYEHRGLPLDYWAKPRFVAACWLALLLPIWLLIHQTEQHARIRRGVFRVTAGLGLLGALVALPKIFWIDIF